MIYVYEKTMGVNPLDAIKQAEYEVVRQEEIVKSYEAKLKQAKEDLKEKEKAAIDVKKEAKEYLTGLLKDIK